MRRSNLIVLLGLVGAALVYGSCADSSSPEQGCDAPSPSPPTCSGQRITSVPRASSRTPRPTSPTSSPGWIPGGSG